MSPCPSECHEKRSHVCDDENEMLPGDMGGKKYSDPLFVEMASYFTVSFL
jgi:hypothetical protein